MHEEAEAQPAWTLKVGPDRVFRVLVLFRV